MSASTTITLDMKKVIYAEFWYENQEGLRLKHLPEQPTARGVPIYNVYAYPIPEYPLETQLERARRLDIVDVWTPHVRFQMQSRHHLNFTHDKATSMWKAWLAYLMGKKKKKS